MSPGAPPPVSASGAGVLPPSDDAHSLPPRRLLNLAFSPCEERGTLPVLSLSPGHHFDNAVGFSPHDSQAGKGLCGGGEILVFIFVSFLFSLNQHKINREDNWRAFKLVCDQGGLPPHSSSPGPVTLGVWESPAPRQRQLGNTFAPILSAFSQAPQMPRLLPPRQTAGCG